MLLLLDAYESLILEEICIRGLDTMIPKLGVFYFGQILTRWLYDCP